MVQVMITVISLVFVVFGFIGLYMVIKDDIDGDKHRLD